MVRTLFYSEGMKTNKISTELSNLLDLLIRYSNVYRGPYAPSRVTQTTAPPGSKILRESLIDHIGALPVIATFLYPYLNENIDIGKVLTMLAVHDIGETKVGDVLTVKRNKTTKEIKNEDEAALHQLNKNYHPLYKEFNNNNSNEAKFAHSVDKISPNLYELIVEKELAQKRHAYFGFDIIKAVKKDRDKMEWNTFLLSFYDELISLIEKRFEA